jgi:hypothetical protein
MIFKTDLESNVESRSFFLAAYKSSDTDKSSPGYNSPLSMERDMMASEEVWRDKRQAHAPTDQVTNESGVSQIL